MRQINELMFSFNYYQHSKSQVHFRGVGSSEKLRGRHLEFRNPTPLHFMMKYNIIKDYAIHTA